MRINTGKILKIRRTKLSELMPQVRVRTASSGSSAVCSANIFPLLMILKIDEVKVYLDLDP